MKTERIKTSGESQHATFRQILQQKWTNIEHYDRIDQNLLVSVFALCGGAIALTQREKVTAEALWTIQWFAVLLASGAIAAVFRSFAEYYRDLGVICRMERALGVYHAVGETPSFPDAGGIGLLFVGVAMKLLRTWRISLLAIYGVIGCVALIFATHLSNAAAISISLSYIILAYLWFVVLPLKRT